MLHPQDSHGFSLIESLIGSAMVAGAIVMLASIAEIGATRSSSARRTMSALVLAQSKLEELRTAPFDFAADGSRVDGEALAPSPEGSLRVDTPGWVELLDRFGAAAADRQPLHYRRRWSVRPLDADSLMLQACVFAAGGVARGDPAEACVSSVRSRKP